MTLNNGSGMADSGSIGESQVIDVEVSEPQANPLKEIHRVMRGRYWLAGLLLVVGSLIGSVGGYRLTEPMYESTGLIRIKPSLPRILYQNELNGVMPMFDAFVESQVALINSQQLIDLAMQHPEWRAQNRGLTPAAVAEFASSLTASHPRGSELLLVSFEDRDPEAARLAVAAVIDAYDRLYGANDSQSTQARIGVLEERARGLEQEHRGITQQINAIVDAAPSGSLEQLYTAKLNQMLAVEGQLQQLEVAIAMNGRMPTTVPAGLAAGASAAVPAGAAAGVPAGIPADGSTAAAAATSATAPAVRAAKPPPLPLAVIAAQHPDIARLLLTRRELERQLVVERSRLGESHRHVVDRQTQLDALSDQIDELVAFYQEIGSEPATPASILAGGASVEELKVNEANLRKLHDRIKAEAEEFGRRVAAVQQLETQAAEFKQKLDETKRRIEQLNVEQSVGGRIEIVNRGERPLLPSKDQRKLFAAAGGLGLGGLGVGVVLLMGFVDRRIRHISDVQEGLHHCNRILGVLPMLPDGYSDPEDTMIAAHSVHQIRMLLQSRFEAGSRPIIGITSSSPGAGKTSLTMALGLSFAASGARTLMIDCDLIGGGLTAKMKKGSRRRLGHILRRVGLITTEQLVAALKESSRRCEPLGRTLIRQGLVSEADVAHALEVQRNAVVGLGEALQGDPVNECITGAGPKGLFIMPLGSAQRQHAVQLSLPRLSRVLEQARRWFDVILVDTGPVLGSLEASVVATAADHVVLAIAKGEQHVLADRAVQQLSEVGARVEGVVLNRVSVNDILASGFSSSASRMSVEQAGVDQISAPVALLPEHYPMRLGPIGTAVVGLGEAPLGAGNESVR